MPWPRSRNGCSTAPGVQHRQKPAHTFAALLLRRLITAGDPLRRFSRKSGVRQPN